MFPHAQLPINAQHDACKNIIRVSKLETKVIVNVLHKTRYDFITVLHFLNLICNQVKSSRRIFGVHFNCRLLSTIWFIDTGNDYYKF